MNSPRPDKEEEEEKAEEKGKKKEEKKKAGAGEMSDTNSSDATDQSEPVCGTSRDAGRPPPRRVESKFARERKVKTPTVVEAKVKVEKFEEVVVKKEEKEDEKVGFLVNFEFFKLFLWILVYFKRFLLTSMNLFP